MTQKLDLSKEHVVLEIGTGSGYQTAVLAKITKFVYTVERHKDLSLKAQENINFLGIENVKFVIDDGSKGLPEYAPYDRIMVTAAAAELPRVYIEQLKPGGKMIVPVGRAGGVQELVLVNKKQEGYSKEHLCYVRFVPLVSE
jgi:protein-L-isoaspartate(D-aspartate) O-methyltransferase